MGRSLGRVRRDWPNGEQRIRYFLSTFACRLGLYCLSEYDGGFNALCIDFSLHINNSDASYL
jgi:hypothetical protein